MSLQYASRNPIIINFTLTNADTWYKVTSAVPGCRKWFIKASETTKNAFDTAFKAAPLTFFSNCGGGFVIDDCDLLDMWCRSSTAGTIIEILYFG